MAEQYCPDCGSAMLQGSLRCACGYEGKATLLPEKCACGQPIAAKINAGGYTEYVCPKCFDEKLEGTTFENELYKEVRKRSIDAMEMLKDLTPQEKLKKFRSAWLELIEKLRT